MYIFAPGKFRLKRLKVATLNFTAAAIVNTPPNVVVTTLSKRVADESNTTVTIMARNIHLLFSDAASAFQARGWAWSCTARNRATDT
ncbi:MAG: hypothetical protein ACSLE6_07260, partial [Mycobacterium sp.]